MLTTLLVSAGTKVLGGFGLNKKSGEKAASNDSTASVVGGTSVGTAQAGGVNGGMGAVALAGMTMRSGTVMEKKLTDEEADGEGADEGRMGFAFNLVQE